MPENTEINSPVPERFLTLSEFGEETRTSERFARRLIAERKSLRQGGRYIRIPQSAVAEFIAAGTVEARITDFVHPQLCEAHRPLICGAADSG